MVIGLERSSYHVDEDAGSVLVCAIIQDSLDMEYNRIFSVSMITRNVGRGYNITVFNCKQLTRILPLPATAIKYHSGTSLQGNGQKPIGS